MLDLQEWFAERVQQLRVEQDLTQPELAMMSGLHSNAIALLERMERQPLISTVGKIITGFGMSPAEFFVPLNEPWEPLQPRPPKQKGRRGPRTDSHDLPPQMEDLTHRRPPRCPRRRE